MTRSRGSSLVAHEHFAPHPCIRWAAMTRTMMQSCASAAKAPRRRAHSAQRHESHGFRGTPPPLEPARQPEAVATGLEGHSNARDLVSRPHRFIAPAIKQRKEGVLICLQFLEWLAFHAGNDTGNQPAREAQLDYGNQRLIQVERYQGSAKVIRLALPSHGG